ncbi:MAG: AAA family ATPase [Myxococcales bacterium]|nr:AAA family ATPase [Myxococcales bacterium]
MLSRLRVQNFRCLRDVTIDFSPLTVLIGKNDSGKTSVLDAIRLLGDTMSRPIPEVFAGANHPEVLSWMRERKEIRWEIEANRNAYDFRLYSTRVTYELFGRSDNVPPRMQFEEVPAAHRGTWSHIAYALNPDLWVLDDDDGQVEAAHDWYRDELRPFVDLFQRLPRYRFATDALRASCLSKPDAVLSASGDTLAAVLDRIFSGIDSSRRSSLEQDLHAAIPTLRGISLRTLDNSAKTIEYVLSGSSKRPVTIPCENTSDGALLVTAYLALAYSDAPQTLLIEEPENGLHPSLLRLVFDTLRKISTGEYGLGPRQVIIATQSPLLLNYATKEEVRIVRRDPETGTAITPLAEIPEIDKLLEEFAIGELWYHLGEDALVSGEGGA